MVSKGESKYGGTVTASELSYLEQFDIPEEEILEKMEEILIYESVYESEGHRSNLMDFKFPHLSEENFSDILSTDGPTLRFPHRAYVASSPSSSSKNRQFSPKAEEVNI